MIIWYWNGPLCDIFFGIAFFCHPGWQYVFLQLNGLQVSMDCFEGKSTFTVFTPKEFSADGPRWLSDTMNKQTSTSFRHSETLSILSPDDLSSHCLPCGSLWRSQSMMRVCWILGRRGWLTSSGLDPPYFRRNLRQKTSKKTSLETATAVCLAEDLIGFVWGWIQR